MCKQTCSRQHELNMQHVIEISIFKSLATLANLFITFLTDLNNFRNVRRPYAVGRIKNAAPNVDFILNI